MIGDGGAIPRSFLRLYLPNRSFKRIIVKEPKEDRQLQIFYFHENSLECTHAEI